MDTACYETSCVSSGYLPDLIWFLRRVERAWPGCDMDDTEPKPRAARHLFVPNRATVLGASGVGSRDVQEPIQVQGGDRPKLT